jgi:hypothetical protein
MRLAREWKPIVAVGIFLLVFFPALFCSIRADDRAKAREHLIILYAPCDTFSEQLVSNVPVRCFKELTR